MKKLSKLFIALVMVTSVAWGGSVPTQITYQGTIKQKGVPVNGDSVKMSFRLTNSDGSVVYWSSGDMGVTVRQGMFSTTLSPVGIDWQNYIPYIEVSVEGQLLLPREPFTSNAYSMMSGGVVNASINTASLADGAVTAAKLDAGVQNFIVPSGMIMEFAGATAPNGWMICDGSPVSRTTYSNLFKTIGISYGPGDGATTFNLPDLRGRAPIGAGQGAGLSNRSLGQTMGEETHQLNAAEMPSHSHGVNDPGHTHPAPNNSTFLVLEGGSPGTGQGVYHWTAERNTAVGYTGISIQNAGGDQPHNIMQPSTVVNFIIKS